MFWFGINIFLQNLLHTILYCDISPLGTWSVTFILCIVSSHFFYFTDFVGSTLYNSELVCTPESSSWLATCQAHGCGPHNWFKIGNDSSPRPTSSASKAWRKIRTLKRLMDVRFYRPRIEGSRNSWVEMYSLVWSILENSLVVRSAWPKYKKGWPPSLVTIQDL